MATEEERTRLNELGQLGPEKTNILLMRILSQLEEANKQLKELGGKLGKPADKPDEPKPVKFDKPVSRSVRGR